MDAILFRRCLGVNDTTAFGTHIFIVDPRDEKAGHVELSDCLNLTTTDDGCIEKIAPFVTALTHSAPITNISAEQRFIYQDGVDTKEWDGSNVATIGALLDGPIVHTPIDVRLSTASKVYKSVAHDAVFAEATLGDTSNIPVTSKRFYGQPVFKQAFTLNGILYGINAADPRFLQHSEYAHYDVWNIGDSHIGHTLPVLQSGAIKATQPGAPGCIIATHDEGVSVYVGTGPHDVVKNYYPCKVIDGTLYSGFISKANGSGHIFLCADGVYLVGSNGVLSNLTVGGTDHLHALNTAYTCATVQDGKYLAFGDALCVEYDFITKAVMRRSSFGVKAATVWNKQNYYAVGSTVATLGVKIDTTDDFTCSLTFPYSDFGATGKKYIDSFYFTGTIGGVVNIAVTDQDSMMWSIEVSDIGVVSNYRVKTPQMWLGNHITITMTCSEGAFRMEELRMVFDYSKRSR